MAINVALATATTALESAILFFLSIAVFTACWFLVLHINSRMTGARKLPQFLATERLQSYDIDYNAIMGINVGQSYSSPDYDWQELVIFGTMLRTSPFFVLVRYLISRA